MVKETEVTDKEVSAFQDVVRLMSDSEFKRTVTRLVKIFERGTATQKAQIKGFLAGVETD